MSLGPQGLRFRWEVNPCVGQMLDFSKHVCTWRFYFTYPSLCHVFSQRKTLFLEYLCHIHIYSICGSSVNMKVTEIIVLHTAECNIYIHDIYIYMFEIAQYIFGIFDFIIRMFETLQVLEDVLYLSSLDCVIRADCCSSPRCDTSILIHLGDTPPLESVHQEYHFFKAWASQPDTN